MALRDLFRWGRKALGANDILAEIARRYRSKSGKTVNVETAISVAAVFACLRVLGHGRAQIPFKLMQESRDGKVRQPAKSHALYRLLARRPNPWQTSYEFREMLSWHEELAGRAYVFKNRSVTGQMLELIPLDPLAVTPKPGADGRVESYDVRGRTGAMQNFPAETIWHLKGPSWCEGEALEVLKVAREVIGLAMAIEDSQASLHRNGVRPSGTYSVEGKLVPQQYEDLKRWLIQENAGADNVGTPLIMDRGAKWLNTSMSNVDAQTIESRKHQVEEICRFFGVMPIMVGYSDKASTYASSEQMFLAHAVHTLAPRWTRFEQSADANLLTDDELDQGFYFDFIEEGMIRGAAKDTKDVLLGYVNGGLMTPNEGRAKLDLNPDPDPESDKLRIPVNTVQDPKAPPDEPSATPA